ncbi:DUF2199 domain-containing protein [Nocardia sp. NPDC056611]|uniref:DUF2199 domain-containing protein n=1 Tax=Nocardia sp. NPDC056611 TaxID=3345877 RepID=UPI00366F0101
MPGDTCPDCGHVLDEHDRHYRFTLPEPMMHLPEPVPAADLWMSGTTIRDSELLQVQQIGTFVRAMLPINLTGGYRITYCVWLLVHPVEFQAIYETWWSPGYSQLQIKGYLANQIPPWGMLRAPVDATVTDPERLPICVASADPHLDRVLREQWPHEVALGSISKTAGINSSRMDL